MEVAVARLPDRGEELDECAAGSAARRRFRGVAARSAPAQRAARPLPPGRSRVRQPQVGPGLAGPAVPPLDSTFRGSAASSHLSVTRSNSESKRWKEPSDGRPKADRVHTWVRRERAGEVLPEGLESSRPTLSRSRPGGTRSPSQRARLSMDDSSRRRAQVAFSIRRVEVSTRGPPRRRRRRTRAGRRSRDSARSRPPGGRARRCGEVAGGLAICRSHAHARASSGRGAGARRRRARRRSAVRRAELRAAVGGRRIAADDGAEQRVVVAGEVLRRAVERRSRRRARAAAGRSASRRSSRRRPAPGARPRPRGRASSGTGSTAPRAR